MPEQWLPIQREELPVAVFTGTPKRPDKQHEPSKWKQFIRWLSPWLNEKRRLGEDYLEARVQNEAASALVKLSEAKERQANARKILVEAATMAAKLDEQKLATVKKDLQQDAENLRPIDAEIQRRIDALEEKLAQAKLLHGFSIEQLSDAPAKPEEPKST
jgi:hypothetical protein